MSGETLYERSKKHVPPKMRVHDYLYDSAYIVSGARDYARAAFRAAMSSAQVTIRPVYNSMFSEVRKYPSMHMVYHANCRLPDHVDRSYGGYLRRVGAAQATTPPQLTGKDSFRYMAVPKRVLALPSASPDFHPATPLPPSARHGKPRSRGTQSVYRESSAQTKPWQPDGRPADACVTTPEVLYLDRLEWGPGSPYRTGDLPADFHTTEIINKMRHARAWTELVERSQRPLGVKGRNAIITDLETKDWIFREAEIDELQEIRLSLVHRMQQEQREHHTSRTSQKLASLWAIKKREMEARLERIRRSRDRELRKVRAAREAGKCAVGGPLDRSGAGGDGDVPAARLGRRARRRHAVIDYDPALLSLEDHKRLAEPPAWLELCGQDLKRTCSGHHQPPDRSQLCPRETRWTESFLESLHNDLKKVRLGAAADTAGPIRLLRPRLVHSEPRPPTPEVLAMDEDREVAHQAALELQKIIRGRAVQTLMYDGRTRAAELTEELKSTHGLQKEDKARVARDKARAREYQAIRSEEEQKEATISSLVDELCGGAVSAALDFLEKELRRLKEERRQHAFILIAMREKTMREAAEAGRRQKEERRRREHDEIFKQVLGVTQESVEIYLQEVIQEGVELAAEEDAVRMARARADEVEEAVNDHGDMSTAEQNELVAELVQQFLLPDVHKMAARHSVNVGQRAKLHAARDAIFGVLDGAEVKQPPCAQCGSALGNVCPCSSCPEDQRPTETTARDDPRWQHTRRRPSPPEKTVSERFPPRYDFRRMLDTLVDEAVLKSRADRSELDAVRRQVTNDVKERVEAALDAKSLVSEALDKATGAWVPPPRTGHYHHYMRRIVGDALERSEPFPQDPCPKELPSAIRQRADDAAAALDPRCKCDDEAEDESKKLAVQFQSDGLDPKRNLLPSELRVLEDMRRCKCDATPPPSLESVDSEATADRTETTYEMEADSGTEK